MERPVVSVSRCQGYGPGEVERALASCLARLGGMGAFVKKGERVVLKPNLLRAAAPGQAATTHPAVVSALSREVERAGGHPVVADTPSGPATRARLRQVYDRTGLLDEERRGGLELNWDLRAVRTTVPGGRMLRSVDILRVVAEADAVITVPKLKTHDLVGLTCATKILFGVVPGLAKAGYHAKFPAVEDFCQLQLDILTLVAPRLAVVDGIVGMEGSGPSAGDRRRGDVLLAGRDSAAVDVAAAAVMSARPPDLPMLRAAVERGLTTGRLEEIEILGDPLGPAEGKGWKLPSSRTGLLDRLQERIPPSLGRRVGTLLLRRPEPDGSLCTGCGECARICPQGCIRIVRGVARIDRGRCQSCFCCSEACPSRAMKVREPPIPF